MTYLIDTVSIYCSIEACVQIVQQIDHLNYGKKKKKNLKIVQNTNFFRLKHTRTAMSSDCRKTYNITKIDGNI